MAEGILSWTEEDGAWACRQRLDVSNWEAIPICGVRTRE